MSETGEKIYAASAEYLQAELTYLKVLIRLQVLRSRSLAANPVQEPFRGLYISDAEIDTLLGAPKREGTENDAAAILTLARTATALRHEIDARRQMTLQAGVYLALPHLAEIFGLSAFEEQVLIICLAPEVDTKYERLYAYLQDDMTRKRTTVDLVMKILDLDAEQRLAARPVFLRDGLLLRTKILRCLDDDDHPLPARTLKLDDAVVNFLLGYRTLDHELAESARFFTATRDWQSLRWPETLKTQLLQTTQDHLQRRDPRKQKLIYHFYGLDGVGKKTLAAGLCQELGVPLLVVDLRKAFLRATNFEETIYRLFRETLLQPAAIFLDHFDLLRGDDDRVFAARQRIAECIDELSWLTFIAAEQIWKPVGLLRDHLLVSIPLAAPDLRGRRQLWQEMATASALANGDIDWGELAAKFRLTPGQMQEALVTAKNMALLRAGADGTITHDDLYQGCRLQSNHGLSELTRKLTPHFTWDDIILPAKATTQLREICAQVKHRHKVYGEWGFEEKLSLGKGLCVLFHGPSGTGKTMAVEIIANALGLDAYKIDLSMVVSKYIGETEKNLSRIFREAETSNAILFFDEADALFGKRSEVKDAHDRYANIEINYLLQRMEAFEGLVILATNLRKNMDEAFFRRMHFAVEFPTPDEAYRYRIWQQHLPAAAPVAGDIDFNFLASRFNITGGNIKNIVVNAAFLAAENSGVIHMEHFVRAVKREYEKIGRMCTESDFAPYQMVLKEA